MSDTDWSGFNTDAHIQAQAACNHIIHCAVDGETRKSVSGAIAYARTVGDLAALPILLLQLAGPCVIPVTMGAPA